MLAWQVLDSAFTSPTYTMRPAPALPAATEHSPGLGEGPESPVMKELRMELFSEPLVVTYLHMDTSNGSHYWSFQSTRPGVAPSHFKIYRSTFRAGDMPH